MDRGIRVERWYERSTPASRSRASPEGELVRVRLRVTRARGAALRRAGRRAARRPRGGGPESPHGRVRSAGRDPTLLEAQEPQRSRQSEQWSWYFGSLGRGLVVARSTTRRCATTASSTPRPCSGPARYTATYLARATTPGTFLYPPAHAEEMYNPGVNGRRAAGRSRWSGRSDAKAGARFGRPPRRRPAGPPAQKTTRARPRLPRSSSRHSPPRPRGSPGRCRRTSRSPGPCPASCSRTATAACCAPRARRTAAAAAGCRSRTSTPI